MKEINITINKDKRVRIQWEGYGTRWDMLEGLLWAIMHYFQTKRPGEVRWIIKIMLCAYQNSVEKGKYKEYMSAVKKREDKMLNREGDYYS